MKCASIFATFHDEKEHLRNQRIIPENVNWDSTVWRRSIESIAAQSTHATADFGRSRTSPRLPSVTPNKVLV